MISGRSCKITVKLRQLMLGIVFLGMFGAVYRITCLYVGSTFPRIFVDRLNTHRKYQRNTRTRLSRCCCLSSVNVHDIPHSFQKQDFGDYEKRSSSNL